ncbi:MAG: hypothetical protein KDD44_09160, partial [Bdellovibrionales bacterium]|nr:hypothetical protein [Bdellovibrionales bacterium]
ALGVVPLAFAAESVLLGLLATGLSTLWMITVGTNGIVPWLYPLFAVVLLHFVVSRVDSKIIFLSVVASLVWFSQVMLSRIVGLESTPLDGFLNVVLLMQTVPILLVTASVLLRADTRSRLVDYGYSLQLWSIRGGLLMLLVYTFPDPWEHLLRGLEQQLFGLTIQSVICGIIFGGVLVAAVRASRDATAHAEAPLPPIVYSFVGVHVLFVVAVALGHFEAGLRGTAVILALLANLGALMGGIHLILSGIRRGLSSTFYTGIAYILILGFLRYVDLIGSYLGAAGIFVVGALILFGAASWWNRQQVLEHV